MWEPGAAIAGLQAAPWTGRAWRFHRRAFAPSDPGGSLRVSGRYHRATDLFSQADAWPALYMALAAETALAEVLRHFSPALMPMLNEYRLSEFEVSLTAVFDLTDAASLGLSQEDLVGDFDFDFTQSLAAETIAKGAEAILVASATHLDDNLVVFPSQLRATSRLTVTASRDPRLYVPR